MTLNVLVEEYKKRKIKGVSLRVGDGPFTKGNSPDLAQYGLNSGPPRPPASQFNGVVKV